MSSEARFKFEFYPSKFDLASMNVELWVGDTCILKSKFWNIKKGKNGPWPAAPQYKGAVDPATGKPKYTDYIQFFPRPYDPQNKGVPSETSEAYHAFQKQCITEYQKWLSAGSPTRSRAKPSEDSVETSAPVRDLPEQTPALPQGWVSNVDRRSGKKYFTSPEGDVYFEDDPKLASAMGSNVKTPARSADPLGRLGPMPRK